MANKRPEVSLIPRIPLHAKTMESWVWSWKQGYLVPRHSTYNTFSVTLGSGTEVLGALAPKVSDLADVEHSSQSANLVKALLSSLKLRTNTLKIVMVEGLQD